MFIRARDGRWTFIPMAPDEGAGGGGDGGDGGAAAAAAAAKTFTQDEVNALVAREKGKFQSKYGDYDDLKAKATKLAEIENASKSDLERLTGERDTLKGTTTSLTAENMRLKVALEKGLVGDRAVLADRLSGDTEEAMKKDADELLKLFGGGSTGFDGGARGNGDQSQSMDALIRRASGRT